MPFLAPVIGWLFFAMVEFFSKFFTLQRAFRLAFAAIMIALLVSLAVTMKSCVTGVCGAAIGSLSASHGNFAVGLGMVFNSTTYTALSCYVTVWTGCQLYIIKKKWVELVTAG